MAEFFIFRPPDPGLLNFGSGIEMWMWISNEYEPEMNI